MIIFSDRYSATCTYIIIKHKTIDTPKILNIKKMFNFLCLLFCVLLKINTLWRPQFLPILINQVRRIFEERKFKESLQLYTVELNER
jgi:hypothetical protein